MHRVALIVAAVAVAGTASAQVIVLSPPGAPSGAPTDRGFSGFGARPISPTAVLHDRLDATDSGAVLGFAVAIRGPAGWYNTGTRSGEMPRDSLPPGAVGQWWEVGARRYRFVYDSARLTLTLFDTTLDLHRSRVVLVTVPPDAGARAVVQLGRPVPFIMARPVAFADAFLPNAPEVRAFAERASP